MAEDDHQNEAELINERKKLKAAETSRKIIRLITVIAYLFSVSMAAIVLSLYYLFFWNPTIQPKPQKLVDPIQYHLSQFYFNVTQKDQLKETNVAAENFNGF